MDSLLTRSPGTYNRLENGQLAHPGTHLLTAVARTLCLDEREWVFLWQVTRKENPPHPLHGASGMSIAGVWQHVIDQLSGVMAYVSDAEFNVTACNDEFRRLFPGGQAPANVMRWLLLDTQARTDIFIDWETRWAPAMMPHLKQGVDLRPGNGGLARLERDVLDDPVAGPLYRGCAAAPAPFYDGSELPLCHPVHGPGWITTCLAEPTTAPGAIVNFSTYTPGASSTQA
ncbi:XRE family transcriptional regulator [Streptomyces bambusae]|uniref:XRE family transcriptional regulator n=2 Tax=Streptomyces bambusae TaxID=1550616 RepID=A0ABS6ZFM1_9ACTN|nr:XRE family transcriptional regulator [Streptomyces bambusae]